MIDIGYFELKGNAKVDRKRKYVGLSSAPHGIPLLQYRWRKFALNLSSRASHM